MSIKPPSGSTLKNISTIDPEADSKSLLLVNSDQESNFPGNLNSRLFLDVDLISKQKSEHFENCPSHLTDIDGNVYESVSIGNQCWMKQNLKVTRYRNGDTIPNYPKKRAWRKNTMYGAYAVYDNKPSNDSIFGKLYNWYAVADPRGLCPAGWHVPTNHDWNILTNYLEPIADTSKFGGCSFIAGGKMKNTGTIKAGNGLWNEPNFDASNLSRFSAIPGGLRDDDGHYTGKGEFGFWWTATEYSSQFKVYAHDRILSCHDGILGIWFDNKQFGQSIRCVKD